MSQEVPIEVVCPRCGRADAVQQVKPLVEEGRTAAAPDAQPLAERLRYGGNLASREIGAIPAGCTVALGAAIPIAVVGAGIVLALLLSRWGYPRAVSLPLGGLVVLAGVMGVVNMLLRLPGFTQQAQEDREAYLEAKAKDQTAFARWRDELYYCFRDDCVFLPGQPHSVPPEQMYVLLYQ